MQLPTQPDRITDLNMSIHDIIIALAEGNPGAVTTLAKILNSDPMNLLVVLLFDTYNIYGSHIYIAYKHYAKEDIDVLISALKDPEKRKKMIQTIIENS